MTEYKQFFCTFINTRGRHTPCVGSVMWCSAASTYAAYSAGSACMRAPLVTIKSKRPVSTRRRRARASSASSSSFCGSETRFWLVGRSGPACRTAPSASACWWTRSSEIHFPVRPAAAWSRASSSSCPLFAPRTTKHLEGMREHTSSLKNQAWRHLFWILCCTCYKIVKSFC